MFCEKFYETGPVVAFALALDPKSDKDDDNDNHKHIK